MSLSNPIKMQIYASKLLQLYKQKLKVPLMCMYILYVSN